MHLDKSVVGVGAEIIQSRLETLLEQKSIVVFDSASDEDLNSIAVAGIALGSKQILCGSAGLAAATACELAERFGKQVSQTTPFQKPESSGVLFVMGSTNTVTQSQLHYLEQAGRTVRIEPGPKAAEHIHAALRQGKHPLIAAAAWRGESFLEPFRSLDGSSVRSLVLSGGDTALAVCRALDASGIKLEKEILPGIPFGRLAGGKASGAVVITKAGGFGNEDALARIAELLAGQVK